MSNTTKHRIVVDIDAEGRVIVWTPQGPVSCLDTRECARVLQAYAREPNSVYMKPTEVPRTYKTETVEQFLARGGKITVAQVTTPLTEKEAEAITLDALGL